MDQESRIDADFQKHVLVQGVSKWNMMDQQDWLSSLYSKKICYCSTLFK